MSAERENRPGSADLLRREPLRGTVGKTVYRYLQSQAGTLCTYRELMEALGYSLDSPVEALPGSTSPYLGAAIQKARQLTERTQIVSIKNCGYVFWEGEKKPASLTKIGVSLSTSPSAGKRVNGISLLAPEAANSEALRGLVSLFDRLNPGARETSLNPSLPPGPRQILACLTNVYPSSCARTELLDLMAKRKEKISPSGALKAVLHEVRGLLEEHCPQWEVYSEAGWISLWPKPEHEEITSLAIEVRFPTLSPKVRNEITQALNCLYAQPIARNLLLYLASRYGLICPRHEMALFLNPEASLPEEKHWQRLNSAIKNLRAAFDHEKIGSIIYKVGDSRGILGSLFSQPLGAPDSLVPIPIVSGHEVSSLVPASARKEILTLLNQTRIKGKDELRPLINPRLREALLVLATRFGQFYPVEELAEQLIGGSEKADCRKVHYLVNRVRPILRASSLKIVKKDPGYWLRER